MRIFFAGFAFVFLVAACQNPKGNRTVMPETDAGMPKTLVDTLFTKTVNTFLSEFKIYYYGTPYDRFIEIVRNRHGIARIQVPTATKGARNFVRNFKVDSIVETNYGFKLCTSFGKKCCPYYDTYFFRYHPKDDSLYLAGFYLKNLRQKDGYCAEKFFFLKNQIPVLNLDLTVYFGLKSTLKDTLHFFTNYIPFGKVEIHSKKRIDDFKRLVYKNILHKSFVSTCGSGFYVLDYIDSIGNRFIKIFRDKSEIARIPLPSQNIYSKDYVKNFGVHDIIPTRYGFDIRISFGGGCCVYDDTYFFKYYPGEDNFYLQGYFSDYWNTYECKAAQKFLVLKHPIPIQKLNILRYFEPSDTAKDTIHDFKNYFSVECQ